MCNLSCGMGTGIPPGRDGRERLSMCGRKHDCMCVRTHCERSNLIKKVCVGILNYKCETYVAMQPNNPGKNLELHLLTAYCSYINFN